jgi:hypothetical protein
VPPDTCCTLTRPCRVVNPPRSACGVDGGLGVGERRALRGSAECRGGDGNVRRPNPRHARRTLGVTIAVNVSHAPDFGVRLTLP